MVQIVQKKGIWQEIEIRARAAVFTLSSRHSGSYLAVTVA